MRRRRAPRAKRVETGATGEMFLGLHGVADVDAAVLAHWRQSDVAEVADGINGLVVCRADAYGWPSAHSSDGMPPGRRWWHLDAGGDWEHPGRQTEMAWCQVEVAPQPPGQRLPFLPLAALLSDALSAVGTYRLTGLHALVPMEAAVDARAALTSVSEWRELTALRQPERTVRVSLAGVPDSVRAGTLAAAAGGLAHGLLVCRTETGADTGTPPEGVTPHPIGHERLRETPGGSLSLSFACTVRGWDGDTAAWLAELFTEALRQCGTATGSVLVSVGA
ncbi:hypothetical protein [Streptomyces qinglanensis]|uniref:Uncharacterized protein n=1 Tax=Streptomyces qinglanensis TaxID=943816 RepID=A0A1H9UW89_9ACTN|nr:hypothetical protein [Streptomyces qinglanensis]SES13725.1 hypothetical protein SAMN05421870_109220 [Streptomyces qinglanensis]